MKRAMVLVALVLIVLTSCTHTVYISPDLPEYNPTLPSRPVLKTTDATVPIEATDNLIEMMGYAQRLEIVCKGWESFYEGLRELYQSDSI